MGFLARLFGRKSEKREKVYILPVVGESHYQDNLRKLCGKPKKNGEEQPVKAMLVPENDNPHDSNAVRVEVDGLTVGYLGRENAKTYRRRYQGSLTVDGVIRGGALRKGYQTNYGIWLDLDIVQR